MRGKNCVSPFRAEDTSTQKKQEELDLHASRTSQGLGTTLAWNKALFTLKFRRWSLLSQARKETSDV